MIAINCYFDMDDSDCIPYLMSHLLVKAFSLDSTKSILNCKCIYQASPLFSYIRSSHSQPLKEAPQVVHF